MTAHAAYKNFGLLAVLILLLGLTFLVRKWPQHKGMTFSQHAAAQRVSVWYYIALFAVVLPVLNLFFINWFVPEMQITQWFIVCILASSAAQFACTVIPEITGWRTQWHRMFAGISAVLLIPPVAVLLFSGDIDTWLKIIVLLCGIVMLGVIGAAVFLKTKTSGWRAQALYFAAFFAAVLTVTYLY